MDYSDIYPCISLPRVLSEEYKEAKSPFTSTPIAVPSSLSSSSFLLGQRSTSSLRHLSDWNPVRRQDRLATDIDEEGNVKYVTPRIPDSIDLLRSPTRRTTLLVNLDAAPKLIISLSPNRKTDLILDSGCTHNMVTYLDLLNNIVLNYLKDSINLGKEIVGNQALVPILGYGDIWPLGRVLYVSGLVSYLISVRRLRSQGFFVDFIDDSAKETSWISMQTIMTASVALDDLYWLEFLPSIHVLLW